MAFVCEEGFPIADVDLPDSLLARYVPESASTIMGTLYNNEKGVGIVFGYPSDILYPILTQYNLKGEKIGHLKFFELANCGADAGYVATTKGTITTDLVVKTMTTQIRWDYEIENSPTDTAISETEFNILVGG